MRQFRISHRYLLILAVVSAGALPVAAHDGRAGHRPLVSPRISYAPVGVAGIARRIVDQKTQNVAHSSHVSAAVLVLHHAMRAPRSTGYQPSYRVHAPLSAQAKIIDVRNPPPMMSGARIIWVR